MNLSNQENLLCTTNSKGNAAMVSHLSPMMRFIARIVLTLICFVWYSSYVHAAVERMTKEPAQNQIEHYYPLGAELEKLRTNLKHLLREASKPSSQGKAKPSTQIENLALIKELDDALREQMSVRLAHLQKQKALDKISQRQALNNEVYERDMNALYQNLETIEKIGEDASRQREKRKAITQALTLLKSPLSRPHESYSNDLDFIGSAPREIYSSQTQINSLLGTDNGSYSTTDSATEITQAITGKVAELGTDPLSLYNWVHDTIRWIPSFGVMQGADYTLQSEQGNAFDSSSLLISLLRAAGHEARYKYGVVNIPADQARNWVGNVKNAAAVANLMSQGGIPQHQYSYGGDVEEIQLEHVWVEVKQGETWYSLDPSFKQYTYTDGLDLENQVAFDAQGLLTSLEESSVSNEAEGWVQGVNTSLIETELANYQTELETYLNNNAPNATLGDVLGLQTIIPSEFLALEEVALGYEIEFSATIDHLPETLFHKFHYQVGSAISYDYGQSFSWGSEYFELSDFTTNLVGKDIAFSFRPATADDEAAIESYLPETIETVDDLPSSLPAGAIQMIGELTVDGEVVHSTPAIALGESLKTRLGFAPAQQSFKFTENNVVAGQYQAIGIDMQGISPTQLEDLQTKLENTQAQLEADNSASLTKHDVVGNIIQAGVQGYLAMTYATDRIAAQAAGVAYYRQPSYGTFSTQME
ncbi:transglutaminase domain-containing protein, partial [Oleiphilus sp. HI0117]